MRRALELGKTWNEKSIPYETVRELESAKGHQLRISTLGDMTFGGEHMTLTFYCTSWGEEA